MKLTFDTADIDATEDADGFGTLLRLFVERNGGHPRSGFDGAGLGWSKVTLTPRPLAVALMGDGADEGFAPSHFRHDATDLEMMWYADGDLAMLFHQPGPDGFTIVNSRNGADGHWSHDDLMDERNDPASGRWG